MPDFWSVFDFFGKRRQQKALRDEDDKELFIKRYRAFLEVLRCNNEVLLAMGDMQEKASGAFVFDRAYVESSYQAVAEGIRRIIDNLNVLADGKYKDLIIPYQQADAVIRSRLTAGIAIPKTDYVLPLRDLRKENAAAAGGKLAHLGEILNALDLPVPPGFVITTHAYRTFLEHNQIQDILNERTRKLDIRNYDELQDASNEMQELVKKGVIPQALEMAILDAYRSMCEEGLPKGQKVSVRSSAIHEDMMSSFAGQYESALNVPGEKIPGHYKNVLASQFTPRALFYYREKGFAVEEMAMAVGVLAMVQAKASGIMYSRDPVRPQENVILINAVWGLGSYAVGGVVPTQNYRVSGDRDQYITRDEKSCQEVMLVGKKEYGTEEVPVPGELLMNACLKDEQILTLASYARRAEAHFGHPQDIEWTIDPGERLFILQSRPLRLAAPGISLEGGRPRVAGGQTILLEKGTIACRGVAAGPVHVVMKKEDLSDFPEGGVLVVRHTHPEFAVVLPKASAVVSDIGNVLGHLATVAREYNVPAIFNTDDATKVLRNGVEVTVDAVFANVYEGIVEEVLAEKGTEDPSRASPVLEQLRGILQMITPLNLMDPRTPEFSPKGCKTLHDVTRFAHEVSLRAIFQLSRESHFAERSTKQLVSGVPLKWWVIDLGDGIEAQVKGKKVKPEEILSIPMRVLWEGMTAAPWKGPPPVDAKGFLSVMLSASTDASIEPAVGRAFADRNYIILSKHYCNVSTRLGFHFSTIEAFVGDQQNQNYISFVYTGGGADAGRKNRRATLIGRLLEHFDFRVEMRDDAIFARLEDHQRGFLEERLKVVGHIIVHTRQMDMVMYNDAMVDYYFKDIMKGIGSIVQLPE
jgi:pyruvate,water dikinase